MSRLFLLLIVAACLGLALFSTTASMTGVFLAPNSPPVAQDDSYTVHGATSVGHFFANDTDPDSDQLQMGDSTHPGIVSNPQHCSMGPANGGADMKFLAPAYGYTGSDSFQYNACDGISGCSTATVTLNIVNTAPNAATDNYFVHGNTPVGPFLANDSDADGDQITMGDATHVAILTTPSHGALSVMSQTDWKVYTPTLGYSGSDSFTYQVCDDLGKCSVGTVNLNVDNLSPIGNADYYTVHQGTTLGPFLENDYDPDGDDITFGNPSHEGIASFPSHGSLSGVTQPDKKFYSPTSGYSGTDSFTYNVCDSLGVCSAATVYVLVLPGVGPATKVPYGCGCPQDPSWKSMFNPEKGGLFPSNGGSGPSAGDPVNLSTGRESYFSPTDLTIYNPSGPEIVWERAFLSDRALTANLGYASPGFTRGWVHNYDLMIEGAWGSWGAVKLIYPSGATENLTPQLSGGVPTGAFTTTSGAPYIVTGVPGSSTGAWQSISVKWKDQTEWRFTLLGGTTYALNKITNRMGKSLSLVWNSNRALTQVLDDATSTTLLTLSYSSNGKIHLLQISMDARSFTALIQGVQPHPMY